MKDIEVTIKREKELAGYQGEDRIISSEELAQYLEKTKETVFSIDTGFETLDRLLRGVEGGELVIVTGPTAEGKTVLTMSMTKNIAEKGISSAWFTLEVTPRQFIKKLKRSGNLPHFYIPAKNTDNQIDWLIDRIIEAKVKHNIKAVFIDHIHQIFSLAQFNKNISLEIGDLVAKIKDLAIHYNLAIFLIAHTKDNPNNPTAEIRKEDIRDSGLISRLADTIIAIWRIPNSDDGSGSRRKPINEGDNKAKIRVLKNRREGELGSCIAYHNKHYLSEELFDEDFEY